MFILISTVELRNPVRSKRLFSREVAQTLDLASRIKVEQQITDAKARSAAKPAQIAGLEKFESYRQASPWSRCLFDFLGLLSDKDVLDLGCGYHPTPIYFALAGARKVYACDVSLKAVAYMRKLADEHEVGDRVLTVVCAAEQLPFAEGRLDLIHGEAVLHHLSLPLAASEIFRVLKNGGRAAFKDPLGHNPVLEFVRDHFPALTGKKSAKATDRPLKFMEIDDFGKRFANYEYRPFGLLSMIATLLRARNRSKLTRAIHVMDGFLLRRCGFLRRFCQFVVTCVQK